MDSRTAGASAGLLPGTCAGLSYGCNRWTKRPKILRLNGGRGKGKVGPKRRIFATECGGKATDVDYSAKSLLVAELRVGLAETGHAPSLQERTCRMKMRPGGETGRRTGLKIPGPERGVR